MTKARTERIAQQIQRDLADLLRTEVKDPRIGMVTLTSVEVSRDHSHAKVYYTALGDEKELGGIAEGLQRAAGFLHSQLFHRLKLRIVPQLHFEYDTSVERGAYLSRLIDEAVGGDS
ncbi:MAG: 30S ribosome-binding factor RbfA [Burkholderiales bacterium]|nr:30S ribosome-binding factor RbfA [Burkholderiales bacterium]